MGTAVVAEAHGGNCGAKAKSTGEPCTQPAGWGTDHPGQGRCRFHGGASPIKHGRYSKIQRERVRDLVDAHREDPDPMDLKEELAVARALLSNFLEREEELQEAFLRWNTERLAEDKKPHRPPALEDAMSLVSEISKIVKRIEDVRAHNALTVKELQRVMSEMGRVVALHVDDQQIIDKIRRDWRTIRL